VHYLLFYDVVDDYITRRVPLRSAHLDYAQPFVERGELILGGALAEPYVTGGLVRHWWVREWTTVLGPLAAMPVQSGSR
jgi:hypothetical protein